MKLKFKIQPCQTAAVQAVMECFSGQPFASSAAVGYHIDPGRAARGQTIGSTVRSDGGFKNADLQLADAALLDNIRQVQRRQNLSAADAWVKTGVARVVNVEQIFKRLSPGDEVKSL